MWILLRSRHLGFEFALLVDWLWSIMSSEKWWNLPWRLSNTTWHKLPLPSPIVCIRNRTFLESSASSKMHWLWPTISPIRLPGATVLPDVLTRVFSPTAQLGQWKSTGTESYEIPPQQGQSVELPSFKKDSVNSSQVFKWFGRFKALNAILALGTLQHLQIMKMLKKNPTTNQRRSSFHDWQNFRKGVS